MMNPMLIKSQEVWKNALLDLEKHFNSDTIYIDGPMADEVLDVLRHTIQELRQKNTYGNEKLYVVLTTSGGSAESVERMVDIFRYNYDEVNFIVPDYAYSAGTILCMSGDSIYMDYCSALGPIDPQVKNKEGRFVPALGYLDKVSELLRKAQNNEISQAEFLILKDFDLAELRFYEQARDYTVDLLKKWLVKYKFKQWREHKNGSKVTDAEKEEKAESIAKELGDNGKWKSHRRPINISALREIGLKIEDYSEDKVLSDLIRNYYLISKDCMNMQGMMACIHYRFM